MSRIYVGIQAMSCFLATLLALLQRSLGSLVSNYEYVRQLLDDFPRRCIDGLCAFSPDVICVWVRASYAFASFGTCERL